MKCALSMVAVLALVLAAPASGAVLTVAPGGGGDCLSAPCGSFATAYGRALDGDVIQVAPGRYGAQEVPGSGKRVTFRGQAGNSVAALDNSAAGVTFDGLVLDGQFARNAVFENHGAADVTFKNGSIGNVTDEKGALITGERFTFDNVTFHDAVYREPGTHMECVYALGVPGMTVRNSTFRDCAIMDLAFTYGSWWTPLPPAYGDITIENNVFAHPERENGTGWHYYALNIGSLGPEEDGGTISGWVVRNNTFESAVNVFPKRVTNSRWVGNLGGWTCVTGMTYARNVGTKCGASDKLVRPSSSGEGTVAPFGWANPGGGDFRLLAGSPAIGAAEPTDAPATDREGLVRDGAPDAGAHEFGASAPTGPPGEPTGAGTPTPPSAKPELRSSQLAPRTICRRARRGCKTTATLRLRVRGPAARVRIDVQRLRAGKSAKRVRRATVRVSSPSITRRVRARGLAQGRYRVVVVVTDAAGAQSVTRRLALRVR